VVDDIFAVRLNGGVVAYVSIYVYRMSPRSTTQPHVSRSFALVQLVGQIDAEKHCAKGLWLEKLSHRT
jgi:hypothetical protein